MVQNVNKGGQHLEGQKFYRIKIDGKTIAMFKFAHNITLPTKRRTMYSILLFPS